MNDSTGIEWTDATWNPVTGCTKVSAGCRGCYAERLFPRVYPGRSFGDVQTHPDRLSQPSRWRKPRTVFVNSMSDLFHEDVPDQFIDDVLAEMVTTPHHRFQVLTKRPERLADFLPASSGPGDMGLKHVWFGVSVEDQATADERIPTLFAASARVRFVSYEPAIDAVDLSPYLPREGPPRRSGAGGSAGPETQAAVDWVIAGGESGPTARASRPEWFRSVRDQCVEYGVPFFFKQWGAHDAEMRRVGKKRAGRVLDGRVWDEMPDTAIQTAQVASAGELG
ncbi:MAG: DUF5131 family protein [Mycobacterium sp.]